MIKALETFAGTDAVQVSSVIFRNLLEMQNDPRNADVKDDPNGMKSVLDCFERTPEYALEIFKALGEEDAENLTFEAAQIDLLKLLGDPLIPMLFKSRRQTRDANASGSAPVNTEAP